MDVSGSMYRFNGHDGRLNKMLETTCLVMEALAAEALHGRYEYSIVGHSGETDGEEFVSFASPPRDRADRLKVLQRMVTHSQFCMSGDNTIQATARAMRGAAGDAAIDAAKAAGEGGGDDDAGTAAARNLIFVLSDANFRRYGLDPLSWADAFAPSHPGVEGYAVMVGSLGDEAAQVASALPVGRGYVCEDADDIPRTFAHIFRHARIVEDESF